MQDEVNILHVHRRVQERANARVSQLLTQPLTTILRLNGGARIQYSWSTLACNLLDKLLKVVPDKGFADPHDRRRDANDLQVNRDKANGTWRQVQSIQQACIVEEDTEHGVPESEQKQERELSTQGQAT